MSHLFLRVTALAAYVLLVGAAPRSESSPDDPQKLIEIVEEKSTTTTFSLVAISKVDYAVTVNADLPTLENLKAGTKPPYTVVVQPRKRALVTKLTRINPRKASRYATSYTCYAGWRDPQRTDFAYTLPWEPGYAYRVGQGFNGQFSHQGRNALDFSMPEGATICAARDGMVIEVTQNFSEGGINEEFKSKANRILILHDDGTTARYAHLVHNGAKVKIGQKVKAGEPIGLAGATGYAKGPHLHFEVDRPPGPGDNQYETVPMQFMAVDEKGSELRVAPKEGDILRRPGGAGKLPPNLIEEIVLCRRMSEQHEPVDVTDIFRAKDAMTIAMRIGAPGERTLKLTITRAGDKKAAPLLFERELKTPPQANYFWMSINLANEPKLRGALAIRVSFNGQQLAEKQFRVE
ncbi:MAG: M23 family metallopeptidase [Anaerolineae bacterium]|nr:M23 family metallopeptidase [Phycisphaerae bacterium]